LKNNYLLRSAGALVVAAAWLGCGGAKRPEPPAPTAPLPTAGLAAQQVDVLPLTLLVAEEELRWDALLADHRAALARADSIVGALLVARAPEVTWVLPAELRRAARRAPGIAPDPDRLGTAILFRGGELEVLPDPLRSELRTLAALAGAGGSRYALVPAGLVFRRAGAAGEAGAAGAAGRAAAAAAAAAASASGGVAELTVVIADVRTGRIGFRTVARGEGDDPWTALVHAVKNLTPGMP
jgi:hypothetical protein